MAKKDETFEPHKIGEVRTSQLVGTYGIGSIIDLPNFSVVVPGINGAVRKDNPWGMGKYHTVIAEDRLLDLVKKTLKAPTVRELRGPARMESSGGGFDPQADNIGTWTVPFPRWFRCKACHALSRYDDKALRLDHRNPRAPHEAVFRHRQCPKTKKGDPPAVPVRFVLTCSDGHLDDFPWGPWAHRSVGFTCPVNPNPSTNLKLEDTGLGQRPTAMKVVCGNSGCGAEAAVQPAFGPQGPKSLPRCGGGRPHLGDRDDACDKTPRAVLVSATNLWFADKRTVLSIPHDEIAAITRLVTDHYDTLGERSSREDFLEWAEAMEKWDGEKWLREDGYTPEEIWDEYEDYKAAYSGEQTIADPKIAEWTALTQKLQGDHPDFKVADTDTTPTTTVVGFDRTRLLTRLREVTALIGFTRLDAPNEDTTSRAPIAVGKPTWVPTSISLGEGVLIRLDEDAVQAWEAKAAGSERIVEMNAAEHAWRTRRNLPPGTPKTPRFLLLHTLSHLLINEITHEAGYPGASIRERIYSQEPVDGHTPQAGILIYTAAADSQGTLGGLVSLGDPDRLGKIITSATERAKVCTSDPFCATHRANGDSGGGSSGDGTLHGAACHVCLFISETSCEHFNAYLDRSLLVPTLADAVTPTYLL